ncbi:probable polygalacturonase [Dioscorea cayenensis subsp. rotundata]|uniref:Probable polygalacturonase n=1 Tax=Dioscorea cayennensis subsp. rotundata TaxID=55577 RepID=A0AB40C6T8_DIOCR|nr:probable polygalacturonase [Dioscorea cayenensis subsp. rotundata]
MEISSNPNSLSHLLHHHLQDQVSMALRALFLLLLVAMVAAAARRDEESRAWAVEYVAVTGCRAHAASVVEFGAVGDGITSNTKAFKAAVEHLGQYSKDGGGGGGGLLYVPAGRWLTGPFNLTSVFTLFLHRDAVILASQDISEWPVIDPLPSYGRGRDKAGGRYSSLLMGVNLTDVILTGDNGTIDGQGAFWWQKFHKNQLKYTRGYLVELMYTDQIVISNLTFLNSPNWNIHPVYSSNIIVSGITILAPVHSPNTDGINPDSCSNVRIEDSYIVSGDDCVAIKSGWDEYGIAFGRPSEHITIKRLTCISPTSAAIAVGSEMSGGVRDVRAEDITAINTESGVRLKTAVGRGAFIKDIYVRGMNLNTMKWVFWMTGNYKSHPDGKFDPNALPEVNGISYSNVVAQNVSMAGRLDGIENAHFKGICLSNVTVHMAMKAKKVPWECTYIEGVSKDVSPKPCDSLEDQGSDEGGGGGELTSCRFPEERLPIEDIEFKRCSYAA